MYTIATLDISGRPEWAGSLGYEDDKWIKWTTRLSNEYARRDLHKEETYNFIST